ncbi:hypothetical protein Tco_0900889 [Tanacetum coccineum]
MFVTWPWAFGIIRNVLRSGKYLSLGHWYLDSSGASCVPGNTRHLAIGTWTHPERLAFWEMFVTWSLALGLIRSVLHSRQYSSLGHWHIDSSGTSCISRNVRHLAIGTWSHPKRLAFREMFVTWPLALGLIHDVRHLSGVLPTSDPACLGPPLCWLCSFGTYTHPA